MAMRCLVLRSAKLLPMCAICDVRYRHRPLTSLLCDVRYATCLHAACLRPPYGMSDTQVPMSGTDMP
eukprot:1617310-Rhodomonas_salina.4